MWVCHVYPPVAPLQGEERLHDSGAAAVAALVSLTRGPAAPRATQRECRFVGAPFMADIFAVRG